MWDNPWFSASTLWSLLDDNEPATEAGHYRETSRSLAQCPCLWVFGRLWDMSLAAVGGQLRTSLDSLSLMSWKAVFSHSSNRNVFVCFKDLLIDSFPKAEATFHRKNKNKKTSMAASTQCTLYTTSSAEWLLVPPPCNLLFLCTTWLRYYLNCAPNRWSFDNIRCVGMGS